jgi:NTP pyrophosphatase (non-canonical NTP hydrolase)
MNFNELMAFAKKHSSRLDKGILSGYDQEKRILHATVKSNEELGELCDVVLKSIGAQHSNKMVGYNKKQIENEIADVFFTVALLAYLLDVDIEKAMLEKMELINARYNEEGEEIVK